MRKAENQLRVDQWREMTAPLREQAPSSLPDNPFFQRFSEDHGAAGTDEMRQEQVGKEAKKEALDLYNEFSNGNLNAQLEQWERSKSAEKAAQKQRKAQKEAQKALKPS